MRIVRIIIIAQFTVVALLGAVAGWAYYWVKENARTSTSPDRTVEKIVYPVPPELPEKERTAFRVALVQDEHRIVDDWRRVAFFRGAILGNWGEKPAKEPVPMGDERPFQALESVGINAVAIRTTWEFIENEPMSIDIEYLKYVRWFLGMALKHKMVVLVQNDQKWCSEAFGGWGAPKWAVRSTDVGCKDVGIPSIFMDRRVSGPQFGNIPGMFRFLSDFYDGTWTPDELALDDHLFRSYVKLAELLRDHPGLLGYSLMTQPVCMVSPAWDHFYPGHRDCDTAINDIYARFATAIRPIDQKALLFVEPPTVLFGPTFYGTDTGIGPFNDAGIVLSGRCSDAVSIADCAGRTTRFDFSNCALNTRALADERLETALIFTDFVSCPHTTDNRADDLAKRLIEAERTGSGVFFWFDPNDDEDFVLAMTRPYPRRVAGANPHWAFDRKGAVGDPADDSDAFKLEFDDMGSTAETEIWVPRFTLYHDDPTTEVPEFTIDISDGEWRWDVRDPNLLIWKTNPETKHHKLLLKIWGRPITNPEFESVGRPS